MREPGPEPGPPNGDPKIDQAYYDSDYFQAATHLADPESRFHRYRIANVLELAEPRPEDRVVDLGCGWGTITFALAPRCKEVVGVDYSERSIAICEDRLASESRDNVSFLRADARATTLVSGSFDIVVAADLYEHLYPSDAKSVTAEAFRLLRDGGRFAIWTPHRGHVLEILKNRGIILKPDPSHVDYKSMRRLEKGLREAGFGIVKSKYSPSHLPVFSAVESAFHSWIPWLRRRIAVLAIKPGSSPLDGAQPAG